LEEENILDAGCIQEQMIGSFESWFIPTDSWGVPAAAVPRTVARAKRENCIVVDGWMDRYKGRLDESCESEEIFFNCISGITDGSWLVEDTFS
jgi:hypothetical protein